MTGKYCTVCKKSDHNTADCWGLGTVCVQPVYQPYVPNFNAMSAGALEKLFALKSPPELLTAIKLATVS